MDIKDTLHYASYLKWIFTIFEFIKNLFNISIENNEISKDSLFIILYCSNCKLQ